MGDSPTVELLKKGYKAFADKDIDAFREVNAEDIVWHTPGNHPLSGTIRGIDGVIEWVKRSAEVTNGTFDVEVHKILGDEEWGVAVCTYRGQRKGMNLEMPGVQVYKRDPQRNQIVEQRIWVYDDVFVNEFWSD